MKEEMFFNSHDQFSMYTFSCSNTSKASLNNLVGQLLYITFLKSKMPAYTLEYFDVKARGELIRLVFAEAGEKYEDKRFTLEDWPKHKPGKLFRSY